jgi:oligopeptide transport system ATP-binding protein
MNSASVVPTVRRPADGVAEPLLELRDVVAGYDVRGGLLRRRRQRVQAVDRVCLTIPAGSTVAVVGESGCGKTTLARTVVGLLQPKSGTMRFDGRDITRASARDWSSLHRDIQMVFQDPYSSLHPRMRVGDLVAEAWQVHPGIVDKADRREEVGRLLRRVGLTPEHAQRFPHQLSGGQRQRVSIARALAVRPRLIVCDEAVSALDVSIRAQILNLLVDLQADLDVSYLFISHDLGVVRHIADQVAVMYLGRVVEIGSTPTVFDNPRHPYTRALLSAAPSVDDWKTSHEAAEIVLSGDVPSPLDPPSGCRFRTRCWMADERCAEVTPDLQPRAGTDHPVACHYAESGRLRSPEEDQHRHHPQDVKENQ